MLIVMKHAKPVVSKQVRETPYASLEEAIRARRYKNKDFGVDTRERVRDLMMTTNKSFKEIAAELGVSANTVSYHARRLVEREEKQLAAAERATATLEALEELDRRSTADEKKRRELAQKHAIRLKP